MKLTKLEQYVADHPNTPFAVMASHLNRTQAAMERASDRLHAKRVKEASAIPTGWRVLDFSDSVQPGDKFFNTARLYWQDATPGTLRGVWTTYIRKGPPPPSPAAAPLVAPEEKPNPCLAGCFKASDEMIAGAVALLNLSPRGQTVLRHWRALCEAGATGLDTSGWTALAVLVEETAKGRRDYLAGLPV